MPAVALPLPCRGPDGNKNGVCRAESGLGEAEARSPQRKRVGRGPAPPLRRVGVWTGSSGTPAVYRAGFPAGDAAGWGQASQVSSIPDRASASAGLAVSW